MAAPPEVPIKNSLSSETAAKQRQTRCARAQSLREFSRSTNLSSLFLSARRFVRPTSIALARADELHRAKLCQAVSPTAWPRSRRRALIFNRYQFSLSHPQTILRGSESHEKNSQRCRVRSPAYRASIQAGRSGNPFGRPKCARRFTADLLDELGEIVAVTSGDQKRAVTKQRAIVDVLVGKALKGDAHAIATIIGSCARALGEQYVDDEAEAPEDRAIMRAVAASPAKNSNSLPTIKSMEDNDE